MNWLQNRFQSIYLRQVSILGSGTILANIITVIATLVLTRLYSPSEIGSIALFNSYSIILANIFTLSYEFAIVIPKQNSESDTLFKITLYQGFIFCCILFLNIEIISLLGIELGTSLPKNWIHVLPLGVFILIIINISQEFFNRIQDFKILSIGRIIQSSFTTFVQVGIGYLYSASIWLLVGFLLGRITSSTLYLRKSFAEPFTFRLNINQAKKVLNKYSNYPKFIFPTVVIDRLSIEAPYLLFAYLFTDSFVGFYAIAFRVIMVPLTFLGSSIGQVFFSTSALIKNKAKPLKPILIKTWSSLALVGVIPLLIIVFGGESLFGFVFGHEWSQTGKLAILLLPLMYLDFISSPTGRTFLVLNLEYYSTIFSILRLISTVGSIFLGYYYGDPLLSLLLYSIVRACFLCIQNLVLFTKVSKYDNEIVTRL